MSTRVKVTYVAINDEYGKPIVSASTFDDLKIALDIHYGVDKGEAECLGFTPYYTKYPEEYEGSYIYKYEIKYSDRTETYSDIVKVFCIEYYPHTIYQITNI